MEADDNMIGDDSLTLSSSHSTEVSLMSVRAKKAGLDAKRKRLLEKVPKQLQWAFFEHDPTLKPALEDHKYELYGHSHPGEPEPRESLADKRVLRLLRQEKSLLISGMTGRMIEFYGSL